jgi:L-2,4-diaminobutyrate decarboxylase
MPQQILADLERDMSPEAAAAFVTLAAEYFAATREGAGPVSTPRDPATLVERFAEPLPRGGRPLADVVDRLRRDVLDDCNRLYHPMYMGHQVSAPLPAAVWTESLTAALNQSAAVFEMSPAATAVETQVVRWMCGLVGFGVEAGGRSPRGGRRRRSPPCSRPAAACSPTSGRTGWATGRRRCSAGSTRTTQ